MKEEMDSGKKQATAAQITALMDFMQEHSDVAKGLINSGLDREDLESQWRDLTAALNAMGGAVKCVDKWKQTWRDVKSNTKKRALSKQQNSLCDTSVGPSLDSFQGAETTEGDNYAPPKKKFEAQIVQCAGTRGVCIDHHACTWDKMLPDRDECMPQDNSFVCCEVARVRAPVDIFEAYS